jgi:hypothetical protein
VKNRFQNSPFKRNLQRYTSAPGSHAVNVTHESIAPSPAQQAVRQYNFANPVDP